MSVNLVLENNNKIYKDREIVSKAIKALIYEVSISPKLGLVSRTSLGSHKDMDFFSFIDSSFALESYFYKLYDLAKNELDRFLLELSNNEEHNKNRLDKIYLEKSLYESFDFVAFFEEMRKLGMEAEKEMFSATKGINTHKGSIFSLGIVFTSYVFLNNLYLDDFSLEKLNIFIRNLCKDIYKDYNKDNYKKDKNTTKQSYGFEIYKKYGIAGAREQAYRGYDMLLLDAYNKFLKQLELKNFESAVIMLLLYFVSQLDDTNIIARSKLDTLKEVQDLSVKLFEKYEELKFNSFNNLKSNMYKDDKFCQQREFLFEIEELNKIFIEKNISAGGSADLLILLLFVYFARK